MTRKLLSRMFCEDELGIGTFVYSVNPEIGFIEVNKSFFNILGIRSNTKLSNIKFEELFVNISEKEQFLKILDEKEKIAFFEVLFRKKDNCEIYVAITACKKNIRNKQVIEGILEDITEQIEKDKRSSIERDLLQGLLDNIPDAIYFKDKDNKIIKVNKFYIKGNGRLNEDIIGKTDFDFFPKAQAQQMFDDDTYVLTTGKSIVGKIERTLLPNGTWNQVITTKIPMYDKYGNVIGTMGVTRDITSYANLENERFSMVMNALTVLGRALEMRDPYTFKHTQNVANISETIGKELNWDANRILGLRLAGELHDIGKISIPLDILNKPGKLSDLEYEMIKQHVNKCSSLFENIKFPFSLQDMISQHHERLDGSGYPKGLKSEDILIEAKILAVSDVLESMTSHRPYRAALGMDVALNELNSGSGTKYDAEVVGLVHKNVEKSQGKPFWLKSAEGLPKRFEPLVQEMEKQS